MRVFIIAEAGVNHNGNIDNAKKMIDAAAEAGVDAVKFQTFKADRLVSANAKKAVYQMDTTNREESQFQMLKRLELSPDTHRELKNYCDKKNIIFLSTPFDIESARMLNKMGMTIIKIPSGEITNLPYLREIAVLGTKIILSTGMSYLQEIKEAIEILNLNGATDISVLHCNTEYPTPMEDVNLRAMVTMKKELGLPVGYSDHTRGIEIPIAAVAMGAEIIEKHFTLNRSMEGPDHRASLEPDELKSMVNAIRNLEKAMGSGEKSPSVSEVKNIQVARRSIIAATEIKKGDIFSCNNITTKRPGTGISPMKWDEIIGQKAKRCYCVDEMIEI